MTIARSWLIPVFASALVAAPSAALAGGTPDGGTGCGSVTFEGECSGSVLTYCDEENDELITIDCAVELTATATCIQVDVDYGHDCALAVGDACIGEDETGGLFQFFCQGDRAACLETLDAYACTEALGPCTLADEGSCVGNNLIYLCEVNQPWVIDCATYSATCAAGICSGVPEDGYCDGEIITCATGLSCNLETGLCGQAVTPDAGVPTPDSGVTPPRDAGFPADSGVVRDAGGGAEDDSGCGCTLTGGSSSQGFLFLGLALVFLFFRRRR